MLEKLSREELIDMVEAICSVYDKRAQKKLTEKEHFALVVKFQRSINHPGGSDLIYYPQNVGLPKNPTVEEIVDLAIKGISPETNSED